MKKAAVVAAMSAACIGCALPVSAQQWPDKSVRILVPFPPGGGTWRQMLFAVTYRL